MDESQDVTAEDLVNSLDAGELEMIIREYGEASAPASSPSGIRELIGSICPEEPRWRRAAERICSARKKKRIRTTQVSSPSFLALLASRLHFRI